MSRSRISLLSAFALAFVAATAAGCGSEEEPGSSGGGDGGSGGAAAAVTTFETPLGPIAVDPGTEKTQCVLVRLDNPEGAFARRVRAELGKGSHHLVVYTSTETTESPEPADCQPFSGILGGEHPILIAQQEQTELVFPDEDGIPIGFEIEPHQMVKIEMHYINTTKDPIEVTSKITFDTIPLSDSVIRSDLALWGTLAINIPPNSSHTTGVKFQPALAGTKAFALTTHQHRLGTEMLVWYSSGPDDTATQVADGANWADPKLELFSPPLDYPGTGGSAESQKGLAFECRWKNPTPETVTFGEGYYDEMCFLWQYYYPAEGIHTCFDGKCKIAK
jgi:hypothetical protein